MQLLGTYMPSGLNDHEVTRNFDKGKDKYTSDFICRREEEILRVYGADAQGGQAKERIKLQSELDRAQEQVQFAAMYELHA